MSSFLSPELVWGLVPRFVGLLYVLAFAPLLVQHEVMAGAHRLAPMRSMRERVARDFPGPHKYWAFPTLLWVFDSDRAQKTMGVLGVLCGALAIYGGPWAFYALLLAWVLWLSFEPRGLVFPWDTMLQEIGFLVLFLPATHSLPSVEASALPLPSVAFMVRWLVIRLMLGFAREKFLNTGKSDFLYLRGFFVWMPMPTPLGWLAHHAPAWMLRGSLLFMFVAEAVAPALALFSGPLRVVSFALLVTLMAGIQATGNWGFFNIGYALLCVSLLDTQSSILDLARAPWVDRLTAWPDLAVHLTMAALFFVSLFYLLFMNSWVTRAWVNWTPDLVAVEPKDMPKYWRIHKLFAPLRAIAPFHLVNGYGVFPSKSLPPMRLTPVFEGSDDGVTWKQYGYRFLPSFPSSRPPVIAPYHARLDQYAIYVPVGTDTGSLLGSLFPMVNPYTIATRATLLHLFAQRILAQDRHVLRRLGHNPFPDAPPKLVRVGLIAMTPTRPRELRETGNWWHIRRVGTLIPPTGKASWPERLLLSEPELFHPDLLAWKRKAQPIRAISEAFTRGAPLDEAIVTGSDLGPQDIARFWDELVPMLREHRGDWRRIHARAALVSAQFGVEGLYRLERVLERYAWVLRLATEPHRLGTREPALPPVTNFRYQMLLHQIVVDGREALEATLRDPARIVERAAQSTTEHELWTLSLLRYEQVMMHVRSFRAYDMGIKGVAGLPSFLAYHDFLVEQVPPDEEYRPQSVKHEDGEFSVEGLYPPPQVQT